MQLLESTRSVLIQLVWCQTKKKKILFLQSHFYCVCMRDRHNKVFVCGQQQTEFFLPLSPGLNRKLSSHLKVDHELHMPRNQNFESGCKVIYPKYSRHWPYLLASTMGCGCSKILNHGLNHGSFLPFVLVFWLKIHF